jgi:hypothetical protein
MMGKKVSDEKILEAMLVHGGVRGAAAVCGISQNAIYKRLQDSAFRARYDELQGVVLSTVAASMAAALDKAVGALVAVLDDVNASPGLKVNAANALLNHANRYIESANIMRRLEALEQMGGEEQCAVSPDE